ncbi:MAG: HAMP domain-containing sensor histidine kinase [Pseudomonadota bacterium]
MHDSREMIRGLAHDINGLMARAALAAENLRVHSDAGVARDADRIGRAIEEVVEICRDGLRNNQMLEPTTLQDAGEVSDLLDRVATLVSLECQLSPHPINFRLSVDADVAVCCSRVRLFRVLFNLAVNAANAISTGHGGSVTIKAVQGDGQISFDVVDDGPGLPPHVLAFLFPTAPASRRPKGRLGTGLITAINISKEMGGSLSLLQTGPTGTAFRLTVPATWLGPLDFRFAEQCVLDGVSL